MMIVFLIATRLAEILVEILVRYVFATIVSYAESWRHIPIVVFLHGEDMIARVWSGYANILKPCQGGPGGGTDPKDRQFFDPAKYKVCSSL